MHARRILEGEKEARQNMHDEEFVLEILVNPYENEFLEEHLHFEYQKALKSYCKAEPNSKAWKAYELALEEYKAYLEGKKMYIESKYKEQARAKGALSVEADGRRVPEFLSPEEHRLLSSSIELPAIVLQQPNCICFKLTHPTLKKLLKSGGPQFFKRI